MCRCGCTGLAVLLVKQSAYNIDLMNGAKLATARSRKSTKAKAMAMMTENKPKELTACECADVCEYALTHGLACRGSTQQDAVPNRAAPVLCEDSTDENLLTFMQSPSCRWRIWACVFNNLHVLGNTIVISACTLVPLVASNSTDSPVL